MKLPIITLFISILLAGLSLAQSKYDVTLAWDKNPETDLVGYKIYQKIASTAVPPVVTWKLVGSVGTLASPEFKVTGVPAGTTTFAVTAYKADVESGYSNELIVTTLESPKGLKTKTITISVGP